MKVGVVSDTHGPRFWKQMPGPVARALDGVDVILHAGDVCVPSVLDELSTIAPVHAVAGNNDGLDVVAWGAAPETLTLDLGGVEVSMMHDSGPRDGRRSRMRRRFPTARVIVFGHSHIPWNEDDGDLLLLNPGSPTDKRRQPSRTVGIMDLVGSEVRNSRIVDIDRHRDC